MLDQITPVVLTFNEAPNIGRVLERLAWAKDVVVVDSLSTDDTLDIVGRFPNVRVFERVFDSHSDQWRFAIQDTGIETDWVMRLDADYILPPETVDEIAALAPDEATAGYLSRFVYCVHGRRLRATLYPPRPRLFRRSRARIYQDGHTDEVALDGAVRNLAEPILHDDRKPVGHWLASQDRYMALEAGKLADAAMGDLGLPDRLRRRRWVVPLIVLPYCLIGRGLLFDGWAGLHYSFQRAAAELILALHLIDRDLAERAGRVGKDDS
ncbi:MAG: glycosyltransferase family 2 protein [Rhodospirillaceae bacterium]|jgi:glycosyltransferase involved in cell wall biosynthesis|nr:glycosyltransferase family 2 protein [Rhodospirillaceae bacterium]